MPLAHHLRVLHSRAALHHCPICHQWFTRTQDIFRHLKKQHPLTKIQDSLRADWLQARTAAARSPCSWCKTLASYKTQHVAACPVLQQTITLRLLVRHELGLSCALSLSARCLEVPLDTEAAGSTSGPHRALPASDWQPDSGGHSALPPPPLNDPISSLATGGRLSTTGAHGPLCPGSRACEETSRVSPSVPCLLRICNRSNHCYANSIMCALCWVEQLLIPAQVIWLPVMHALTRRMSLKAPVADLWDSLQWTLMHAQWRLPHHQHDVAEYLCYCRRFLIPDLMRGVWQSRLLLADDAHAQCQVRDCGDAWPILFATPLAQAAQSSSGLTIQRLVHTWQHQAVDGFTAFESAPSTVVLQLNRFCEGTAQSKDDTPVIPDSRILLPCFQHSPSAASTALHTRSFQYQLCAIITHTGSKPTDGHYRAVLCSYTAGSASSSSSSVSQSTLVLR